MKTAINLSKHNKVVIFRPDKGISLFNLLTNHNKREAFVKQLKSLNHKLTFFPTLDLIPLQRFKWIKRLNYSLGIIQLKFFCKLLNKKPILWIFNPQFVNLITEITPQLTVYDCVDFHTSINSAKNKKIQLLEKKITAQADIIFTNSPSLYKIKQNKHPLVFEVPQGCSINLFLKNKTPKKPEKLKNIPSPYLGFIGIINYRIDFELIENTARLNPNLSILMVGPINTEKKENKKAEVEKWVKKLNNQENIYFIGRIPKQKVVNYIDRFDICFIPYNINHDFCRYSYPMKVFEYFARKKPVITTPIESLKPLQPYVKIVKNAQECTKQIQKLSDNKWPKKHQKKQVALAQANSWENKLEKISLHLEKQFPETFHD